MSAINLPDLVQKVKVDTTSMQLAAKRAAAFGAAMKKMSKDVAAAQRDMQKEVDKTTKLSGLYEQQQKRLTRMQRDLNKAVKDNGYARLSKDIDSSTRSSKLFLTEIEKHNKAVANSTSRMQEHMEGVSTGIANASKRTKTFRKDVDGVVSAMGEIPSKKTTEIDIEVKARRIMEARQRLMDLVAEERTAEIDVEVNTDQRAMRRLAQTLERAARRRNVALNVALNKRSVTQAQKEIDRAARDRVAAIYAEVEGRSEAEAKDRIDALAKDRLAKIHPEVDVGALNRANEQVKSFREQILVGREGHRGALVMNLLNITKLALALPVTIVKAFGEAVETAGETFKTLNRGVELGGHGLGIFKSGVGAAMSAISSLATSGLPAAIAAAGLFAGAVGGTASLLSLLTANVFVLTGALTKAIVGPLMAAIPAVAAFGAGAVVAGVAIYKWAKNSDALQKAIKPVSSELDRLAEKITPTMDGLTKLFGRGMLDMVRKFSGSVQRVLDDMYLKLKSPAMDEFYHAWQNSMPRIFERLGKSINAFGAGLIAFFRPILPYAEKLAQNIKDASDRFLLWSQSAKGQNSIKDWMDEAWDISTKLWSGLKDIGAAILDIMGIGMDESGGDFAQWVKDIGDRFHKWTESEQGRKDIKQWFKDAEELAKDLKDIIAGIGDAFDTLDSPEGRRTLNDFMDFVKFVVAMGGAAAHTINEINTAINAVGDWLDDNNADKGFFDPEVWDEELEDMKGRIEKIKEAYRGLKNWIKENGIDKGISDSNVWSEELEDMKERFARLREWWSGIDWSFMRPDLTSIFNPAGAMAAVTGWVAGIVSGIQTGLTAGLMAIPGILTAVVTLIPRAIIDGIKSVLGIESPSTVMIGLMQDVGAGLVLGLQTIPGMLWGAVTAIGTGIVSTLRSSLSGVWGAVSSAFGSAKAVIVARGAEILASVSTTFAAIPGRIMGALSGMAGRLGAWAGTAWSAARTAFSSGVAATTAFFAGVPGRVISAVSSLGGRLAGWAGSAWRSASSAFTSGVSATISFMAGVPGRIIGAVGSLAGRLSAWASAAWRAAASAFSAGIGAVVGIASTIGGRVLGALGNMGSLLTGVGADLIQGFVNGVASRVDSAVASVQAMGARVIAAANSVFQRRSPSKVFRSIGDDVMEGFVLGFGDKIDSAADRMRKAMRLIVSEAGREARNSWGDEITSLNKTEDDYRKGMKSKNRQTGPNQKNRDALMLRTIDNARNASREVQKHIQIVEGFQKKVVDQRYAMDQRLLTNTGIAQKKGTPVEGVFSQVEDWMKARDIQRKQQDAEFRRLNRIYQEKAGYAEFKQDQVGKVREMHSETAAARKARERRQREYALQRQQPNSPAGAQQAFTRVNEFHFNNYNPVAEKSSESAIRNVTNIAQLTDL